MSLSKYFGQATDSAGAPLYWENIENFPFRGPPPSMLKGDEIEKIPEVYDAKATILTLPDDVEKYQDIIDHCANGIWFLRHEKFEYDKETKKYTVLLSWLEIYREMPKNSRSKEVFRDAYKSEDF